MNHIINLKTNKRIDSIEITKDVESIISKSNFFSGLCVIYSPHTTSGIMINEGYDPSVVDDLNNFLSGLVPHNRNYKHLEGNSDAHIKSSIIGPSKTIIIENGKLSLGTWQQIFFMEFDGPRSRNIYVKLIKG
ncbi:MAG: YjbQ family protein [Candidatus Methanofastidiosa archaeon]|nr:YjbQ family protein [Candidatus Methanofastidiosa archaeon]